MVLSQALRDLKATPVPGHAVVGSGRAGLDPSATYSFAYAIVAQADKPTGPYASAFQFNNTSCPLDYLGNYIFNLDPTVPP